jgi:hypothetical protein
VKIVPLASSGISSHRYQPATSTQEYYSRSGAELAMTTLKTAALIAYAYRYVQPNLLIIHHGIIVTERSMNRETGFSHSGYATNDFCLNKDISEGM